MLLGQCVTYVACSQWLADEARKSALLKGQVVTSIPNPIDTHVFRPQDKQEARRALNLPTDKRIILFVSQRVTDPRKGMGGRYSWGTCRGCRLATLSSRLSSRLCQQSEAHRRGV